MDIFKLFGLMIKKINKNIINERKMRDCGRGYLQNLFIFYIYKQYCNLSDETHRGVETVSISYKFVFQ